jgi:putative chitinase
MITTDLLRRIMPESGPRAALFTVPLVTAAAEFDINAEERIAAWLAQLAHESGQLRYVRELASGEAYEGRKDLGNTQPGDGVRFRGRGLIQITGRANYEQLRVALGLDCVAHPEILEDPHNAARVSGWFWKGRGLNELADGGTVNFTKITRRINGGTNGLADREMFYSRARAALGLA